MADHMAEDGDQSPFNKVPVMDVHADNFQEVWPSLILAMSTSTLIALDTELSGLGERKLLQSKSIEERYKGITETAKSRSILSLGISCFNRSVPHPPSASQGPATAETSSPDKSRGDAISLSPRYSVQTYNIWTLCQQNFVVEPASLRFLVNHGFDFNMQYAKGVPYYRGSDQDKDKTYPSLRQLFVELVKLGKPVALHNGLVDLVFLYENLYASVPSALPGFLADLVDIFPGGLFDSKYITDFEHKMPASYLEYVYRKCQRDNSQGDGEGIRVQFPSYLVNHKYVTFRHCAVKSHPSLTPAQLQETVCPNYAGHGWCSKDPFCPKSHDIDLILDLDGIGKAQKGRRRNKRKQKRRHSEMESAAADERADHMEGDCGEENAKKEGESRESDRTACTGVSEVAGTEPGDPGMEDTVADRKVEDTKRISVNQNEDTKRISANQGTESMCSQCSRPVDVSGGHRAGYDAFMTGYILATYLGRREVGNLTDDKVQLWKNKLYLSAKDYPLTVMKSSFAKSSKEHLQKIARIRATNGST